MKRPVPETPARWACLFLVVLFSTPVLVHGKERPDSKQGNYWLIAIGVAEFDDSAYLCPLGFSVSDARAMHQELTQFGAMFDKERAFLLTSKGTELGHSLDSPRPKVEYLATARNVEWVLQHVKNEAKTGDTILFYASTHGFYDPESRKSYFTLKDSRIRESSNLLAVEDVNKILDESSAAVNLLIVDACRENKPVDTGQKQLANPSVEDPVDTVMNSGFGNALRASEGNIVLVSASNGQYSYEPTSSCVASDGEKDPPKNHGVYTHYLLEGLRGGALGNENGNVTVYGLQTYVNKKVTAWCIANKKYEKYAQTPWYDGEGTRDIEIAPWARWHEMKGARDAIGKALEDADCDKAQMRLAEFMTDYGKGHKFIARATESIRECQRQASQNLISARVESESYGSARESLREYISDFGEDLFSKRISRTIREKYERVELQAEINEELVSWNGTGVSEKLDRYEETYAVDAFSIKAREKLAWMVAKKQRTVMVLAQVRLGQDVERLADLESRVLSSLKQKVKNLEFESARFMKPGVEREIRRLAADQSFTDLAEALVAVCAHFIVVNVDVEHVRSSPNPIARNIILQEYRCKFNPYVVDVESNDFQIANPQIRKANIHASEANMRTAREALRYSLEEYNGDVESWIHAKCIGWMSETSNRQAKSRTKD